MLFACASQKGVTSSGNGLGDTRTTEIEFINSETYRLTESAADATYAYTEANPVKVGGAGEQSGPRNERRFLNALLGPGGEQVSYYRAGSCCPFRTPNGLFNDSGLLDLYRVTWEGARDTVSIYINMYDKGDLLIPVGFTAKE